MELKSTKSTNMKYIINERQYKLLVEQEVLHIPSLELFDDDWDTLQKFLERRGNPLFSIGGDLNLSRTDIESLGNLYSVEGYLDLESCHNLKSLGSLTSVGRYLDLKECYYLTSLGNLTSVGTTLHLRECINLKSLGNLTSVGKDLQLRHTQIANKYSDDEIREMVKIGGELYT
jgi:hypothetical protein